MSVRERSMGVGLRALTAFAGSAFLERLRLRRPAQRLLYRATRDGFRATASTRRAFKAVKGSGQPVRLKPSGERGVFDLTPSDEQQMICESLRAFACERLRPAAADAESACGAPPELLDEAAGLGVSMLGVPEALGGALSERSAVTAVLAAEALSYGDMGLALALLAPAGVASALGLWGDADQQATYLPALLADDPPAAALALQEPRALFDPRLPRTRARRDRGDFILSGEKSLVPCAAESSLLLVSAEVEDEGPALFLIETAGEGVFSKPAPAMGVRAAATGDVRLDGVRVPAGALLGGGDPAIVIECVRRARLGWCALALGTCRAVLDYAIPYVNERVAFGEPISHRQAVAFAISDIAIELEGMRLATLRAASRADAGHEFAEHVALARSLCAVKAAQIGSQGVQLLGGHGYVTEHPVERWYRDLQAVGVFEGALLV